MSSPTQSCSVPLYTVMVSSGASYDMSAVNANYCNSSSCTYIQSVSVNIVSSYNVSVACRNTLNQTGQPYVTMQSELGCCHVTSITMVTFPLRCSNTCTPSWSAQCEWEQCYHQLHIPEWLLPLLCGLLQ